MMMFFICLIHVSARTVSNKDKPAKGEFQFPMDEVWSTQQAGEDLFGLLVEFVVSDSGHIYCRDLKNKAYYIFDPDGKFLKKFGEQGEAPGQVQQHGGAGILIHKDTVLIEDASKIHYFDAGGNYIRSSVNNHSARPISILLNENEFITAPSKLTGVRKGQAQVKHVNLKTGSERVITDFTLFNSGILNRTSDQGNMQARATIPTITPVMVMGYHDNQLYFGMNSTYDIFITDMNGKEIGSFSLTRKPKSVSLKEREDILLKLVKGHGPPELARQLAKTLPDKETYFHSIEVHDDLIYVFRSHFPPKHIQQIDIFSKEGKYLYKSYVKLKEGHLILSGPTFQDGHMYIAWEDEEGEGHLGKFNTSYPQ